MRKKIFLCFFASFLFPAVFGQTAWISRFAVLMDSLAASHYEDQIQAAFGTFTYEYSELATPFSRWLEDELTRAVPESKRMRLFNRAAAAAMDPAFRAQYADFFASNQVDALLSGKFFKDARSVRIRFDLTSLRNGNLIGSGEMSFRAEELPGSVAVAPEDAVVSRAKQLAGLVGAAPTSSAGRLDALALSLSTDRGPGGAYRDGENLKVHASVNQDSYVRLFHIDAAGSTKLMWPNRFGGGDGRLKAGASGTIPGPGDPFDFKLGAPYGTEFVKAVASSEPFARSEADFQDLGTDARGIISRGLDLTPKSSVKEALHAEALASYVIIGGSR